MDFKYNSRLGKVWDATSLKRTLEKLGVKTLEDAIKQEREKIKAHGYNPIETSQPEPSSIKISPPPIKPRLPYADDEIDF